MDEMEKKAFVFGSLFALSNRLQVVGDRFDANITIKQWLLLVVLIKSGKSSLPITELAQITGSSHQNIKKMAVLLEKQGFLRLEKKRDDARVVQVSVTPACLDHLKTREGREKDFLDTRFTGIPSEVLDGLYQGFGMLAHNLEAMEKEHA
jgi:DNA-binding MarR family transcriptional regulator